jgi:ACS family allantoate permease-like MFS transporter
MVHHSDGAPFQLTTFGSLINKAFGFTNEEVILYGIPRSVVSVCLFFLIMYSTRRWTGIRFWIMMAACVPPFVGLLSIALLPTDVSYKWTKWGMYLIAVTFIIPTFMGWQMIPSNVAGKTKRTVCSSINFIAYCVGKFFPPYVRLCEGELIGMSCEQATSSAVRCSGQMTPLDI